MKFIKCQYCNGEGKHYGPLGPLICLICNGEKYIPDTKGYAKIVLDNLSKTYEKQTRFK